MATRAADGAGAALGARRDRLRGSRCGARPGRPSWPAHDPDRSEVRQGRFDILRARRIRVRQLRVGLAQINPTVGDVEGNARRVLDAIERARALGADLVAFPELALHRLPAGGPALQAGASSRPTCGRSTDVARGVDRPHRGRRLRRQARRHLQRRRRAPRRRAWPASTTSSTCRTTASSTRTAISRPATGRAGLRARRARAVGVNICEDIWYPTGPTHAPGAGRRRAGRQHQRLALPRRQGALPREDARHARGRRRSCAWPSSTLVGGQDELVFDGVSLIVRPERRAARARAAPSRRTWWSPTSTSTPSSARGCTTRGGARRSCGATERPSRRDRRSRRCRTPAAPAAAARTRCRCSSRSRRSTARSCWARATTCARTGSSHVVIGLSGGIDSALVAAIAVRRARRRATSSASSMPSRYSSAGHASRRRARWPRTSASSS